MKWDPKPYMQIGFWKIFFLICMLASRSNVMEKCAISGNNI